jgi:hypothetical protein
MRQFAGEIVLAITIYFCVVYECVSAPGARLRLLTGENAGVFAKSNLNGVWV